MATQLRARRQCSYAFTCLAYISSPLVSLPSLTSPPQPFSLLLSLFCFTAALIHPHPLPNIIPCACHTHAHPHTHANVRTPSLITSCQSLRPPSSLPLPPPPPRQRTFTAHRPTSLSSASVCLCLRGVKRPQQPFAVVKNEVIHARTRIHTHTRCGVHERGATVK